MVDVDVDVCSLASKIKELGGFVGFFIRSLVKNAPGMVHPCPYNGSEGLKDADLYNIMGDTYPQIIPKGTYRMLSRFHLKNNQTFLNVIFTCQVDAHEPLKSYDMMGK